jgi:hypothetical protein
MTTIEVEAEATEKVSTAVTSTPVALGGPPCQNLPAFLH